MKALIVTPLRTEAPTGNRVTSDRWAGMLRDLGHEPEVAPGYDGQACDVLIALHARKSAPSIARFRAERPRSPLLLALTGTDLYRDLARSEEAQRSLDAADRLVVLQPLAVRSVPERHRAKVRTILQSVERVEGARDPRADRFEVCVLGHLREVKDPLRTAVAARLLPADSRVHVVQIGAALEPEWEARARAEERANPRYAWLGALTREDALRRMAACRLLCLTSRLEGGANAVSEAMVHDVPVVSSRIDGSLGLLGEDYPGCFPPGDTAALAGLLRRAETEPAFVDALRARGRERAPSFHPRHEREAWRRLLAELG